MIYTRENVRELDFTAINKYKISGYDLMQKAAKAAFLNVLKKWPGQNKFFIFCGIGNNGGDGFVFSKLAKERGYNVKVILCGDESKIKGDAKKAYIDCKDSNIDILKIKDELVFDEMKLKIFAKKNEDNILVGDLVENKKGVIVDALFGTGLNKKLDSFWIKIINFINEQQKYKKLSIDIPSGLNANTGITMGACINSDLTITFVGRKQGLYTGMARDYCKEIIFDDLGIPKEVYSEVLNSGELLDLDILKAKNLADISHCTNKNNFGHVLIVGGNLGMLGASILAAKSALRSGAGLVSVATRDEHASLIPINTPEIMSKGIEIEKIKELSVLIDRANVILIGPGLGLDNWSRKIFSMVIDAVADKLLIIDADGLNLLSEMKYNNKNCIITPHVKEASRLLNITTDEINKDRFDCCKKLFEKYCATVILKGAGTIIYGEGQRFYITTAGNYGMATAGMGDVLSGVVAALCARGISLIEAAKLASHVHALAADKEIKNGKKGMIATDLLKWIRVLLN